MAKELPKEASYRPKSFKHLMKINGFGLFGPSWRSLLEVSWAVLEASWGLLAAKTHQKRGRPVFWRPLGAVLASFLGGFWMVFGMSFQYFSYLIHKDLNMS